MAEQGKRFVGAGWEDEVSQAEEAEGYRSTLLLRLPARATWSKAQQRKVQQIVADAALYALQALEKDGVST